MEEFYYRDEHHVEYAPTTRSHLQELLLTKQISEHGEIRREGSEEWLPILEVIRLPASPPNAVPQPRPRAKWKNKLSSFMDMMNDPSNVKLVAGFAILLVVGTIYQIYEDKPEKTGERKTASASQTEYENYGNGPYRIVSEGYFGFVSKHDLDRARQLQPDKEAFKKFLVLGLISGAAVSFKPGETVYQDDSSWGGDVQLRRQGEVVSYWTVREAIRK